MSVKEIIENLSLFNGLRDEELNTMVKISQVTNYPPGSVIIEEGSEGDSLMIINKGSVDVIQKLDNDDHNIKLATLGKGTFFGEMALIDVATRSATVVAKEETEVITIMQEDVSALLEGEEGLKYIPILVNIARGMSTKLRKANESLSAISDILKKYYYSI
ncbi:MAG: cyclic nucleotide-binding domain-containing protein [Pseudomonadota bacterium]